jgi:hypothetical protein
MDSNCIANWNCKSKRGYVAGLGFNIGRCVGHSVAGPRIIVRKALLIFKATCLLVFSATPHWGGKYASVGEVAARICTTALGMPNNDLLNALKRRSNEATKRFEQGRHIFDKYLVVSFSEGASCYKIGIACLFENPRERETSLTCFRLSIGIRQRLIYQGRVMPLFIWG